MYWLAQWNLGKVLDHKMLEQSQETMTMLVLQIRKGQLVAVYAIVIRSLCMHAQVLGECVFPE
jgi:hypothetical protein